jgi:hypothetical protein
MDRKNKSFDAVKMVREIRDKHHKQFGDKPIEERIAYYRRKARDFRERAEANREETTRDGSS